MWDEAEIAVGSEATRSWYVVSGGDMSRTLGMAATRNGYTLTDRPSWLRFRNRGRLQILVQDDPRLVVQFGAMSVNPARYPGRPRRRRQGLRRMAERQGRPGGHSAVQAAGRGALCAEFRRARRLSRPSGTLGRLTIGAIFCGPGPIIGRPGDTILSVMNARSERSRPRPWSIRSSAPISYLRVSVTDRCDFRCVYCMAEDMTFLPKAELLTLEELDRLCSAFVRLGVRKLRLTGGEPLVRRNVMSLIGNLGRHLDSGALDELTLTTNGSQLAVHAEALSAAGVRRINVSLDTLDPEKFQAITRWGQLDKVMDGIAAAKRAGLAVKINAVALKGVNEDEFDDLVAWCGDEGFDLTFIEVMPMGEIGARAPARPVPAALAGARAAAAALDARRHRLPHRRPGALCARRGDRRPARLHHAAHA